MRALPAEETLLCREAFVRNSHLYRKGWSTTPEPGLSPVFNASGRCSGNGAGR
ncbi:hypothetical protein DSECCO2_362590 [anaerobic digester metagenome]